MTSLSSECLDSIKRIDSLISDKGVAVGEAICEAYAKHAELSAYNSNVIMEDFWTPEREEGESIWKTIFLFIPRMLYAIANAIKEAWTKLKLFLMTPEQKFIYELAQKTPAERLKSCIQDDRFDANETEDGVTHLYIKSRIARMDKIAEYFNNTVSVFEKYLEYISSLEGNPSTEQIKQVFISLSTDELIQTIRNHNTFSNIFTSSPTWVEFDPDFFSERIKEIRDANMHACETVSNIANTLKDVYNQIDGRVVVTANDIDANAIARDFKDNMMKQVTDLQTNSAKVGEEIKQIEELSVIILNGSRQALSNTDIVHKLGGNTPPV